MSWYWWKNDAIKDVSADNRTQFYALKTPDPFTSKNRKSHLSHNLQQLTIVVLYQHWSYEIIAVLQCFQLQSSLARQFLTSSSFAFDYDKSFWASEGVPVHSCLSEYRYFLRPPSSFGSDYNPLRTSVLNKKQIPSIKHFYPIVFGGKLPPHLGLDDRGRGGGVGEPGWGCFYFFFIFWLRNNEEDEDEADLNFLRNKGKEPWPVARLLEWYGWDPATRVWIHLPLLEDKIIPKVKVLS